jgi:group I intron endonuclease
MMDRKYCVYKHTVPNGKVYIGLTAKNPLVRWNGGYGYLGQPYFWSAIVKYGWQNIKHEILYSELTEEEASEHERRLIAKYDSTNAAKGYNISPGGSRGHKGLKRSAQTRDKIRESNIRRWESMTPAHREEEVERCRHMFEGRHHSEQSKKMCMLNNPRRRQVIQLTEGGEVIAAYDSIREAERKNNIKHPGVYYCLVGKIKTTGGYVWKYKE